MREDQNSLEQERKWIAEAKKDPSFFRPLYEKYANSVYRYFVRRTDDLVLAEELCSTTFYKALDRIRSFTWQGKPFGAWLFRIAANELRKHFRDRKPIYIIEEDKLDCIDVEPREVQDFLPLLIEALDQLSDFDLRLLELKFFEEKTFKEISHLLDVGESAAKMRIYRLLSKLKRSIEEDDQA